MFLKYLLVKGNCSLLGVLLVLLFFLLFLLLFLLLFTVITVWLAFQWFTISVEWDFWLLVLVEDFLSCFPFFGNLFFLGILFGFGCGLLSGDSFFFLGSGSFQLFGESFVNRCGDSDIVFQGGLSSCNIGLLLLSDNIISLLISLGDGVGLGNSDWIGILSIINNISNDSFFSHFLVELNKSLTHASDINNLLEGLDSILENWLNGLHDTESSLHIVNLWLHALDGLHLSGNLYEWLSIIESLKDSSGKGLLDVLDGSGLGNSSSSIVSGLGSKGEGESGAQTRDKLGFGLELKLFDGIDELGVVMVVVSSRS